MNEFNNYINGLMQLGMSEREARVYLALIKKQNASIADLQKHSGVRSNKMSEVVNSLVRQGLCSEKKVGQRKYFNALDPGSSLKPILGEIETRLEKGNKLRKNLSQLYESAEEVREPSEYIEIIRGNENIHRKYMELLQTIEFELLGFNRPPFASNKREMKDEQRVAFYEHLDHKKESRGVYEVNESSLPRMYYNIDNGFKIGESLRIVSKLPLKMFIFDRKVLLIAEKESLSEESELTMTVVKQKSTINGYLALFEFFWEQGLEYEEWIKGKEELMERKLAEYKGF